MCITVFIRFYMRVCLISRHILYHLTHTCCLFCKCKCVISPCTENNGVNSFLLVCNNCRFLTFLFYDTVKPLNSGHLQVLKHLSVIERCPVLGGNLKKIFTFVTKCFVRYSWHVRYFGYPLMGGFTVFLSGFYSVGKLIIVQCSQLYLFPYISFICRQKLNDF